MEQSFKQKDWLEELANYRDIEQMDGDPFQAYSDYERFRQENMDSLSFVINNGWV
jgi:hypothetical protein